MDMQTEQILSDDEIDILQEIMNISFGKSAADLADVIDTHVVLSVPFIRIVRVPDLPEYFKEHVREYKKVSIVEQKFWGRFKGDALLAFSSGAGRALINMLHREERPSFESDPIDILERESLMEIGNILIGACVGKLAELLKDSVTYTPPLVLVERDCRDAISENRYDPKDAAIVMKTDFCFDKGDVSGFLFLVTRHDCVTWLKDALRLFIEQYE